MLTATRDRGQLPSGIGDKERGEASFYLSSVGVRSSVILISQLMYTDLVKGQCPDIW